MTDKHTISRYVMPKNWSILAWCLEKNGRRWLVYNCLAPCWKAAVNSPTKVLICDSSGWTLRVCVWEEIRIIQNIDRNTLQRSTESSLHHRMEVEAIQEMQTSHDNTWEPCELWQSNLRKAIRFKQIQILDVFQIQTVYLYDRKY